MKSLVALFLPCVLLSAWLLSSPAAPPAADQTDDPDEQFLREAKLGTDNASLIAYLKKRSDHDDDLLHLDRLIRQLGDTADFGPRSSWLITTAALPKKSFNFSLIISASCNYTAHLLHD
jgi:hypothetical protein